MLEKEFLIELQDYIEEYLDKAIFSVREAETIITKDVYYNELEEFVNFNRNPSFAQLLFSFIDRTGNSDSDIYKKAGIDRRHFSKIRSNPNYRLGKYTAIALALALELNKIEMDQLLSSAGFSLSNSDTFDLAIQFCVKKRIYNIDEVNQALEYLNLKSLI